jgi:hypothetical protein
MVMPECQKFTRTEVNQHSGETLALNVPAQHSQYHVPSTNSNSSNTSHLDLTRRDLTAATQATTAAATVQSAPDERKYMHLLRTFVVNKRFD